jgi:hypothetical protein
MKNLQGCWQRGRDEDGTPQLGLLIDPKSDSSVSKVVQQLPYWIEAPQGSEVITKQPLRKIDAQVCE